MDFIQNGRVIVNGQVVIEPSTLVNSHKDKVCVDGVQIKLKTHVYILLNKPKGYVTTTEDAHAEKTVLDLLPDQFKHLYPAGRLDKDTEGLLLLTNDGDVAYKLTHPKFQVDKIYFAKVDGTLKENDKICLEKGIVIDNQKTAPAKVTHVKYPGGKTDFHIAIHEGRKRQIRLMLKSLGYRVIHLKRIAQGPLLLENLPTGRWRPLKENEIAALKKI